MFATIKMRFELIDLFECIWIGFILCCANCFDFLFDFYRWNGHQSYERHVLNVIYLNERDKFKEIFCLSNEFCPCIFHFNMDKKKILRGRAFTHTHTHMRATYVRDNQWGSSLSQNQDRKWIFILKTTFHMLMSNAPKDLFQFGF